MDIPFLIWLINNSLRILFGFDLEVFQKQILEDRKGNKENFIIVKYRIILLFYLYLPLFFNKVSKIGIEYIFYQ